MSKLKIERVDNGYILKGKFGDSDIITKELIEDENPMEELTTMKELLLEVKAYFGIYYSKHNRENLIVEVQQNEK